MPFPAQTQRIPTSIGLVRVRLTDLDGTQGNMSAKFYIEVFDQDGQLLKTLDGDLVPYITVAQRNALIQCMQDIRAQAENEVL